MATLSGGDKLEKKLAEIAAKAGAAGTLRVGYLEGSTYPDGTSVPMVAAVNEYGRMVKSKDGDYFQMPRPSFRNMIAKRSPRWAEQLGKIAVAADYDMKLTLDRMGQLMVGQLQGSIRELVSPPLAESTIKAKGFSKPLIDTAIMINSVSYEVTADGETSTSAGAQMSEAASAAMKGGQ